ncbi:MAG: indole-3-glycerol phosphate synthase TrpC [Synergistaceae bacterium]|nr:indole-3-glycerol phosphate synthase TrpC [Synergistaceae bacterium]
MFLDRIVNSVKKRLEGKKAELPLLNIRKLAQNTPQICDFPFEKALSKDGIAFICEVKKASPSKGVISHDFPYLQIAADYAAGGAAAVSVLTEPEYFHGSDKYLREISGALPIPTLRKDFIIDAYQIYEAKILGASAVLLIAEILEEETLREYINIAHELGLSVLAESHSLPQMEKVITAGARVIGVNNRNLETFEVDINTSIRLRSKAPEGLIFVSESGIVTAGDIATLRDNKVDAVLIGETLMRSADRVKTLEELRRAG